MLMLLSRNSVTSKTRVFLTPLLFCNPLTSASAVAAAAATCPSDSPPTRPNFIWAPEEVTNSFKSWFISRKDPSLELIKEILNSVKDEDQASRAKSDWELSRLGLRLTESFVLKVLKYCDDVFCCVRFFDWAGRQRGFSHTRATFHGMFKKLARSNLALLREYVDSSVRDNFPKDRFHRILVMGYALAGKPEISLQLLGSMRFKGQDLDSFAYNVLLNSLVEGNYFDAAQVILHQMEIRGYTDDRTRSTMMKILCKLKRFDEAEEFLRRALSDGLKINAHGLCFLVEAFCKSKDFDRAGKLVSEFGKSDCFTAKPFYGIWIKCLVEAGRLNEALKFLRTIESAENYVPDAIRYNILIHRLLKENRLKQVFDLLLEMKQLQVVPDKVTMNIALCFFCKAGMVEVALQLFESRPEIGLTPNAMVYNHLVNTLCGDSSVDEALHVLASSAKENYLCGRNTFSNVAHMLRRQGKLDKLHHLVVYALDHEIIVSDSLYDKVITALSLAGRLDEAYKIYGYLNQYNKVLRWRTYGVMINGFIKSGRGDIARFLLLDMQEKGHKPTPELFRKVIGCLFDMDNPEAQFVHMLEAHLQHHKSEPRIYNYFIDGAGYAGKHDWAEKVFELMLRNEVAPNLGSDILLLQSYLNSGKISSALSFFSGNISERRSNVGRKFYNAMISGLCKCDRFEDALEIFKQAKEKGWRPSLECYEELVKVLCSRKRYADAIKLVNDMQHMGRPISTFIGNVLLYNSYISKDPYHAWVEHRDPSLETPSSSSLRELIAGFSGRITAEIEDLEEMIKLSFPPDVYTYNLLLRKLTMDHLEAACRLYDRLLQRGFEPNEYTFDIMGRGYKMRGLRHDAKPFFEEAEKLGLYEREKSHL